MNPALSAGVLRYRIERLQPAVVDAPPVPVAWLLKHPPIDSPHPSPSPALNPALLEAVRGRVEAGEPRVNVLELNLALDAPGKP